MCLTKYKHIVFSIVAAVLFLTGLFLLLNSTAQSVRADPGDWFVTPGGSGDCSQSSPCDLETALSLVGDEDTLYLAQGMYTGTGRAVVTITHSIAFYGGWDGATTTPPVRDPDTYLTTLCGENARHVIHISGNIAPTIDGLIITNGKAEDGGGIYIHNASPIIQNNVITANYTIDSGTYDDGRGGGIYVDGSSTAIIVQNHILSNTSGYGGGIYHNHGTAAITVISNEIVGNLASRRGGGILIENAPDLIQTNVISGNIAGGDGGGLLIWHAGTQIEANRIVNNSANRGGGISLGNNATPNLYNNLFLNNTQDGFYMASSSPVVVNNTIVGNGLLDAGNGIHLWSSSDCSPPYCTTGVYSNNIVINYEVGIYGTGLITPVIDHNDVWGNSLANYALPASVVTGTHNISADPLFIDPAVDDYHLQSDSPCIDTGDPAGVPPAPPTDFDGDPRPYGNRVDIGADEFGQWWYIYLPLVVKNYP